MKKLKEIVEEIEATAKDYRESKNPDYQGAFNQYVELLVLDAPKTEQYNLCNYWERLKR